MSRVAGDRNVNKREIIRRRDEFQEPPLIVTNLTRICIICTQFIRNKITKMERDLTCLLNVLTQTANRTCVICNADADVHRITFNAE